MRQLRYAGHSQIAFNVVPDPRPAPGEVIVQTVFSAICGSELHTYRGEGMPQGNNGHEAVGVVAELGEGVTNLTPGQRVGVSCVAGCGTCNYCRQGQYTWCTNHMFYGNMHAERFVAAASACHPLPDDIGWEAGVLLTGDGLGVPYHTSRKISSPEFYTIAVFGVGPIGLGNVMIQSHLGRRVIAVDLSEKRLQLARELGAEDIVHAPQEDPVKTIHSLTDGKGADVCIEAAGEPETALACFQAVRTAGTVVFNGEQKAVPLSPSDQFIRRDITAVGAWFYHFSEFSHMLELYRHGLAIENLITHRFSFHNAADGYAMHAAAQTGKVLLNYQ
ncbi:MAG: zinc-binding dehydrogenase [Anaerolineae bacterium]|nr:zinc-binding dehydrogenase [Anaerolineae bacterium]